MTNPTTEEIVAALRICSIGHRPCEDCVFDNFDGDISCTQALGKAAADRLEELSRWIPVTERLPEDDANVKKHTESDGFGFLTVLVYNGTVKQSNRYYCKESHCGLPKTNGWEWTSLNVTHWKPLPEPPKEE